MLKIPFTVSEKGIFNNFLAIEKWARLFEDTFISHNHDSLYMPLPPKFVFTAEGGLAVRMTNRTGSASVKGTVVTVSDDYDDSFVIQNNEYDAIGVVYENGIANGSLCLVVISGMADVLLKDGTSITRGDWAICADTDGRATDGGDPGAGLPAVDKHFKEIGHFTRSASAGTNVLCRAVLHFN